MKPTIDDQIRAVALAQLSMPDDVSVNGVAAVEVLEAALSTLRWVKRYAKPSLDALMAEFPGAKVAPQDQDD
jgi:hypothetical protein